MIIIMKMELNASDEFKIRIILEREYSIKISLGRVYRIMKSMNLPTMSTMKPKYRNLLISNENFENTLKQKFNPHLLTYSNIKLMYLNQKVYIIVYFSDFQ